MIDYKNGETLFKIFSKLKELRMRYYVDCHGVFQVKWAGKWTAYHEVMKMDKRLEVV